MDRIQEAWNSYCICAVNHFNYMDEIKQFAEWNNGLVIENPINIDHYRGLAPAYVFMFVDKATERSHVKLFFKIVVPNFKYEEFQSLCVLCKRRRRRPTFENTQSKICSCTIKRISFKHSSNLFCFHSTNGTHQFLLFIQFTCTCTTYAFMHTWEHNTIWNCTQTYCT